MKQALPEPIATYFTANNAHNIDAMLAPFAEGAWVRDEGVERNGLEAIREWMEETTRKYGVTVDVKNVAEMEGKTVVTGRVTGNFPGSPVDLRYHFNVDGKKISRLEIVA